MAGQTWEGGPYLQRLIDRKGLDRDQLAELINAALDTNYSGETIARWIRGRRPSAQARAFLNTIAVDPLVDAAAGGELPPEDVPLAHERSADTAPGPGPGEFSPTPAIGGSGAYTRACTELVEIIATGVGLVGAGIGSQALVNDGAIIQADAAALGAAYGKLAEQNETFRRMLVGMTSGGVWMQVAMVSATTFTKCWQNHGLVAAHVRAQRAEAEGQFDVHEPAAAVA